MQVEIDGLVWVLKSDLKPAQLHNLREELTVLPKSTSEFSDDGPIKPIRLFSETPEKFGIPRAWYKENAKAKVDVVLNVSDGAPMRQECQDGGFTGATSGTPRFDEQSKVVELFTSRFKSSSYGGEILEAGCAFGKTVTACRIAYNLGCRTAILVHKEFFLKQWKSRIEEFFPGARVGITRQKKCQFKGYDFVICLVQSLAARDYGEAFYSAFGLVITDEVHRIGAATWAPLLPQFNARFRLGLSATLRRSDGCEDVFFQHIGPIGYTAKTEGTTFMVSKLNIPFELKAIRRGSYYVAIGDLNHAQMESQIAEDLVTNANLVASIVKAVRIGRKCFVVSTRTEQLYLLEEMLKDWFASHPQWSDTSIGWVTGSSFARDESGNRFKHLKKVNGRNKSVWKMRKTTQVELDHADTCQVMLATKQMIEEGYDNQAIDALYLAMPISDPEQTVGRGRRPCTPSPSKCEKLCSWRAGDCQGKPTLVVKDVVHIGVRRLENRWKKRARFYRAAGVKVP